MIPRRIFLTKGVGVSKEKLQSFEIALRDAGIHYCNIVSVSSILPPGCRILSREKGIAALRPGQIIFSVLARNDTNEPNRLVAASIGLAKPWDGNTYGYISEHHSFGENEERAGDYAQDLAATMLASTLGIDFDPESDWDRRREVYRMSGKIVESRSVTQTARGDKLSRWTTVVAAAVFLLE
jgi:arginine decarboxylase